MPAPIVADWKLIESLFLQGVGATQLANDTGVAVATINQRARRGGWVKLRKELNGRVAVDLAERAKSWRTAAIGAADRFLEAIRLMPQARVNKLARQDVQNLRDVIEAGLRAYGLDKAGTEPIRLGVYVGSGAQVVLKSGNAPMQAIGMQGPIIDCECAAQADPEPKGTP